MARNYLSGNEFNPISFTLGLFRYVMKIYVYFLEKCLSQPSTSKYCSTFYLINPLLIGKWVILVIATTKSEKQHVSPFWTLVSQDRHKMNESCFSFSLIQTVAQWGAIRHR